MDDIDRNAIERGGAIGGVVIAPVRMNANIRTNVGDDGGRVGGDGGIADILIPRIIRGEKLLA